MTILPAIAVMQGDLMHHGDFFFLLFTCFYFVDLFKIHEV